MKRKMRIRTTIFIIFVGIFLISCATESSDISSESEIEEENQERDWIIEMTIYAVGHTGSDYLIQISEDAVIRTRFGTRDGWEIETLGEDFFREVQKEEENVLNVEELQLLLDLAQDLEETGGIMELDIAEGSWEVILIYNGIMYGMDYWRSDFELFKKLIDAILELSPIQVELHGWS